MTSIIGALATFQDRIGIVEDTINSLVNQVDLLMIYCNDEPSFQNARKCLYGNVKKYRGQNLTDRGKFYWCKELAGTDTIYMTFDDDLIYPYNYVETTIKWLSYYQNKAIISYHGKQLIARNINSFYQRMDSVQERFDYRCLDFVKDNQRVDIIGTGCMAWHLDYFCPEFMQYDKMADIQISIQAKNEGKTLIVCQHLPEWIKYNKKMKGKYTIWDEFKTTPDKIQTKLINDNWK